MKQICLLVFLLHTLVTTQAAFTVGGGVGIGVGTGGGGGGGGVWVGGGINTPTPSSPPSSSASSKMSMAYTALQTWKSAIEEDPLGITNTWVGPNVCSYTGVFCSQDITSGETIVAGIDLNHGNLQGTLVKELSLLTDLSLLHLNTNRFSGTIPETFQDLTSLTELDLSNNKLSGPFPTTTLLIPNLIYLDLRFNSFSGQLPQSLFSKKLDAIFVNNNNFDGEIPPNLGTSPASVINLANNKFSGEIPFSLNYMGPEIKEILFLNNQLTGCVPQGVGLWTNLQVLDVSFNSLMGHLPDSISCLSGIEVINLAHNKLSGELPDMVCELSELVNLTLSDNFFSGFGRECDQLIHRNIGFDFSFNCIPGRELQRPQPECSMVPGGSLNCLRIPTPSPLLCGALVSTSHSNNSSSSAP